MSFSIQILNPVNDNPIWEKHYTKDEYEKIEPLFNGRETLSIFQAALMPARTNTLENFVNDFFFPTFMQVQKVHLTASSLFDIIGALCLDILTFPIRLITCIPRINSNANLPELPLKKYLRDEGLNPNLSEQDFIRVRLQKKEGRSSLDHKKTVNFIEMPWHKYSTETKSQWS